MRALAARAGVLAGLLLLVACPHTAPPTSRPAVRGETGKRPAPTEPTAPLRDQLLRALRKNLREYNPRIRRCHELAMAEDRKVGGRISLELTVAPAGVVVETRVTMSEAQSPVFARCLQELCRSFVFPASDGSHQVPMHLRFQRPEKKLTVRLDDVPPRTTGEPGVSVKPLLGPHNVSGDRLGLVVLRLEGGSTFTLGGLAEVVGVHVLQGTLRLEEGAVSDVSKDSPLSGRGRAASSTGAMRSKGSAHATVSLGPGQAATVAGFGPTALLANSGPSRAAALLFLVPGSAAERWHGALAATTRPSPPASKGTMVTGALHVLSVDGAVGPSLLPTPRVVEVRPGRRALVNPKAGPMHHALLVTGGALWITVDGERLPAEAGMGLYLPAGLTAQAVSQANEPAQLVIMPWPDAGKWDTSLAHPLVRFSPSP